LIVILLNIIEESNFYKKYYDILAAAHEKKSERSERKKEHQFGKHESLETEFTEICRWKYVLHAEAVSKDEILVVDRPVGEILASLPPAFHTKKFSNK